MKYRSKMYRKFIAATMTVALITSSFAPMVSANPGNGNGNGQATSEERGNNGNNSQGPKRAIEDVEILDSTSFMIDFDKTYPKGLDINRIIDVEVELEDETVVVPELTDYMVSSDDRSHVTVEHVNDDLDGLSGTLSINDFEIDFDYGTDEEYGYYEGQSILDIRETDFGTTQTFYGTVTAHFEAGGQTNMYVQDDTAAILVRGAGLGSQYNLGDKVQFTGEHNHFRDMKQILVSDSEIVEKNHGQIEPKVVDSTFFEKDADEIEAQLIEMKDVTVRDNFDFDDFNADDAAGDFLVYGAYADVQENTEYDSIFGVVNYHFYENKLMPRDNDDLVEDASVVQSPRANYESGAIASGSEVTLSSGTEGADIYYTINGEDPTAEDMLYDGPITITEETTLKAIAMKDGLENSDIREYQYTLLPEAGELEIYDIQGASHTSPYEGQVVRGVPGIVTHTENNGFYFQSAESDGDVNTSEGMYVYSRSHEASVGDEVLVDGKVVEYEEAGFHDFSSDPNNDLRTTQMEASNIQIESSGNDLPDAIVVGVDREIPEVLLADPENYDINDPEDFDAEANALDFYESLEGMLIEIPGQVTVTGPQKYDELTVISEEWGLENRTESGSVYVEENEQGENYSEFNTEVMFVVAPRGTIAKTGDYFEESIVGVVGYDFSNFKIQPVGDGLPDLQDGGLERRDETTIEFEDDKLTVATYNVENFHPDANPERIRRLANSMANELNSPDIITLVEVMDNYGEDVGPDTDASASYQTLIDAIEEKSGVEYAFTEVAPIQGNDGGIPGGNIRNGHLYRVDRVELADDSVAPNDEGLTIDEQGNLSYGTGLIDPTNDAFRNSRKPLLTEFNFKGESVYVIGNHWNSKRGDEAPFGIVQPAEQGSREQRLEIAEVIGDFVAELNEKTEEDANVVVLGDFNDYPWSPPVDLLLESGNLYNAIFELERSEQYTYSYNGSAQSLDSILVSEHLQSEIDVDAMGINSEFMWEHGRASDHDPIMVQLEIPDIDPDYEIVPGPELTFEDDELNSNATMELTVGDDFDYPEVTATDSEGNDLTVERGGDDVDANTAGTYIVVYRASDEEGRSSTLRLTVVVKEDIDRDNLTVAQAIANNDGEGTVQGYIVGTMTGNFDGDFTATNLMLADDPDERNMDKILPVQLPNTSLRSDINLQDNPENLGKEVRLTGNLAAYFSRPGLRDTSEYEFVEGDDGDSGNGDGEIDRDNLTVAQAIANNDGEGTVQGYIVGTIISGGNGNFDGDDEFSHTNLMLADDPDEREMDKVLYVQLPNTSLRADLNLRDNPDNLGEEVRLTGSLEAYFGYPGLRNTSEYEFVEGDGDSDNGNGDGETSVMSISDARDAAEGTEVTVEGVVTTNPGSWGGQGFAVQDDSAGIYVFQNNGDISLGDQVKLTGTKGEFNGEIQITDLTSLEVKGEGELPEPTLVNLDEVAKNMEGQLVKVEGVEINELEEVNNFGTFEFNAVVDEESVLIRVDNRTGLDYNGFTFENGDIVDVTGIVAEYQGSMQLKPRMEADISASEDE
ncbi:DUF6359 domain-containing protein [Salipaludibacillus daqingensis]|uniref:DUF6359 domain-containing protein n=1 Tax=Salipaludibacillus daqingensis TaxID=3041001 RepID=UPI002475E449|nr:DUF6359 domain-containing protein [Salipaludibacillus daqingensis]